MVLQQDEADFKLEREGRSPKFFKAIKINFVEKWTEIGMVLLYVNNLCLTENVSRICC